MSGTGQTVTSYDPYRQENLGYVSIPRCQGCGSERQEVWKEFEDRTIVKCGECGFLFLNPRPDPTSLKAFYEPLSSYDYEVEGKPYVECESDFIQAYHLQLEEIEGVVRKGRLLEIGSALGYFLEASRQRGWEPFGVEISREGAEHCRRKYGIEVYCGEIRQAGFPSGYFDCVVSIHTLEHVDDPFLFVQDCARVLRLGGILVIEIPYVRDDEAPEDLDEGAGMPAHLSFFTEETLRSLVESRGFSVLHVGRGENLRIIAKKVPSETSSDGPALARLYESLMHLGETLFEKGCPVEALECFQLLTNLFPKEGAIYNNIGSVYWAAGDREMAGNCFLKAGSLDGMHWETLLNLVLVSKETGNEEVVKPFIEGYRNRYPDSPKARELEDLLRT